MNIDKFKKQHIAIIDCVTRLRHYTKAGISENATEIAQLIISMSSLIKLHLAVEDNVLYPALLAGKNTRLASLGKQFQEEMGVIAVTYLDFVKRWNTAANVSNNPEGFRSDANRVLKILYARMQRENTEFYPAIEAL